MKDYKRNSVLVEDLIKSLKKLPKGTRVYVLAVDYGGESPVAPELDIENYQRYPEGYACIGYASREL